MKRTAMALAVVAASCGGLRAAGDQGTTAAQFLSLSVDARAAAMGGAATALLDNANSLFSNPAGLARLPGRSVALLHAPYVEDSRLESASYGQKIGARFAAGAGALYFSPGSLESFDELGQATPGLEPSDVAFVAAGAASWRRHRFGFGIKTVKVEVVDTARTTAVDLGYEIGPFLGDRLRAGASVLNLGGSLRFDGVEEELPLVTRFGIAYFASTAWTVAVDSVFARGQDARAAIGFERTWVPGGDWTFAIRGGFDSGAAADLNESAGLSGGFGVGRGSVSADYALASLGSLGATHRLSLAFGF